VLPDFAAAWLAFDGFSPESARGPHTPNLLRAREKWRKLAPKEASALHDNLTASPPNGREEPQGAVEIGAESASETARAAADDVDNAHAQRLPREWVPIIPSSSHAHPDAPITTSTPKSSPGPSHAIPASGDDDLVPNAPPVAATADPADVASAPTPMPMQSGTSNVTEAPSLRGPKLTPRSRRERILHLARQNARTPLPERLVEVEEPQPQQGTGDEQKLEVETEQQGKERTIRERLWRLVGGNY
jgi:hypothetical protein